MAATDPRASPLLEAALPVRVATAGGDEGHQLFTVRVLRGSSLRVELTSEQGRGAEVYALECCEGDFHALKAEQGILVDFGEFPTKFIELIRACLAAAQAQAHPTAGASR